MKLKLLVLLFFISCFAFAQVSPDRIGSTEVQESEFTISPNPAKNGLNIKLSSSDKDFTLEVFDVLGKRVYKSLITKLDYSVNVTNWKSGVYLVRLSNDEATETKRFIKQ